MSYAYPNNNASSGRSTSSSPPPPLSTSGRSSSSSNSLSSSSSSPSSSSRRFVEVSGLEHGVIQSVKESYAFILCAEREGELFFHMSDVTSELPPAGLRKGDEVSFVVCSDPAQPSKLFGKRIALLPPGSVHFEVIEEEHVQGIVDAELKNVKRPRARLTRTPPSSSSTPADAKGGGEGYGGRIRRTSPPSSSPSPSDPPSLPYYEFAERDLTDPSTTLGVGDVVSFSVFVERKSGRRGATAVRLLQLNPVGRQRGVVSNLKEGFGFIRPEDGMQGRVKELFFHFSSLLDPAHSPTIGDELEYAEQSEGGRTSAARIALLPKGSIRADSLSPTRHQGTLDKDLDDSPADAGGGAQRSSVVRWVSPEGAVVMLPFTAGDCREARPVLLQGDEVSFAVMTRGKTGEQRATQVALVNPSTLHRERGVVVTVNPTGGFAFIRRVDRDGELFLHATNFRAADFSPSPPPSSSSLSPPPFITEGTEVEFNPYIGDNGRPCAVRAIPLPPGSVQFEVQWEGRYWGTVTREAKRKRDKGEYDRTRNGHAPTEEPKGEVKVTHLIDNAGAGDGPLPSGDASAICTFLPSSSSLPLLTGDVVECSVAVQRSSGQRMARNLRLLTPRPATRERGLITQLGGGGRTGRISSSSRTALLPFDSAHFLQPEQGGKALQVGDGVEFDVVDGADPSSSSSSSPRRNASYSHSHDRERKVASRLLLLPPGSVSIDSIDRVHAYRGRVEDIPSNPKNPKATPGHIAVLSSKPMQDAVDPPSPGPVVDSSPLSPSSPTPPADPLSASLSSLSFSTSSSTSSPLPAGTLVPFTFKDIAGHSFLARGDVVEFFLSTSSSSTSTASPSPSSSASSSSSLPHAADVTLLPLTATVSSVAGDNGVALGSLSLMSVTSSTPSSSSTLPDETLVYLSSDVVDGTSLHSGDVVSVSAMSFHAERKRRQAKTIRLVKAAPKRVGEGSGGGLGGGIGERRKLRLTHSQSASAIGGSGGEGGGGVGAGAASPTAVVTTMRFARGPDETRGFAPRRSGTQQGVHVGLQRLASSSAQAQTITVSTSTTAPMQTGGEAGNRVAGVEEEAEQPAA